MESKLETCRIRHSNIADNYKAEAISPKRKISDISPTMRNSSPKKSFY